MQKVYNRIVWENFPSERTALNESNLNRMDLALDNIDNRVIEMDATKVNVETANTLIRNWTIDEETGVITVEKLNGEKIIFDLNIEKIPVNFELSDNGILTMTTDDGSKYTANIGAMIPVLTFEDSDEIAVSATGTGVNKTYSFSIKAGSVTEDKLQPNFLADVKTEVAKAKASQESAVQSASDASSAASAAAISESNAKTSETAASESASAAKESETNAEKSAGNAASSAQSASDSAGNSLTYANRANESAVTASAKAAEASESAASASDSATSASTSASSAEDSATAASRSATLSESYTHGGTGAREGEDADNAKYYYDKAKSMVTGTLGYVTPEMFGAVGDGVTNDTIAFEEALLSGYPICLSKKTYRCNLLITKSGTIIYGCGIDSVITPYSAAYPAIRINTQDSTLNDLVTGVVLRDFTINGDISETMDISHTGFFAYMCQSLHVTNVKIERCYSHALYLAGVMDSTFDCCEVIRCANKGTTEDDGGTCYSVTLKANGIKQSNAIKFTSCRIEHSPRLLLMQDNTFQISFIGCKFETGCRGYSTNENVRPIYIRNQVHNVEFSACCLTYNMTVPTEYDETLLDNGRYFLRILLDDALVEGSRRSNVTFSSCVFSSAPTIQVCWALVNNTTFVGCEFSHSYGGKDRASLNFSKRCIVDACTIIPCSGNRTFLLNGESLISNTMVIPDGEYENSIMSVNANGKGKVEILYTGKYLENEEFCYFSENVSNMYVEFIGMKTYNI